MQQGGPEARHGHGAEHLGRGGGLDATSAPPGEHGDRGRAGQRPQQHRRQPCGGQPAGPCAARVRDSGAQKRPRGGDQRDPARDEHRDVRGRPPRPVQGDDHAVEHRARRPRGRRRGDEQHTRPRRSPGRPGRFRQQRGQRRRGTGYEHGEHAAHGGAERDGRRQAAHHDPADPPARGRQPRDQGRAAVRPRHAGRDGDDRDDRDRGAEPVRRQGPGREQPGREAARGTERGGGGKHPAVAEGTATCGGDRPQPRHRGGDRVAGEIPRSGHGRHDARGVDRHRRRVRAGVGPVGPPGRRRVAPRDRRPRHPHRRVGGSRSRRLGRAHSATTAWRSRNGTLSTVVTYSAPAGAHTPSSPSPARSAAWSPPRRRR